MKKAAGCLILIVIVFGAIAALVVLGQYAPGPAPDPHRAPPQPVPGPKPDPNVYKKHVDSLNEFGKSENGDQYLLKYGFIDYHGNTHRVSCYVKKGDHERETEWYGYDPRETDAEVDTQLQRYINKELEKRGLTPYMKVTFYNGGGYRWNYDIPTTLNTDDYATKVSAVGEIMKLLETVVPERERELETRAFKKRGFLLRDDRISIDYAQVIERSEQPLLPCITALREAGRDYNDRQNIGLFLAFFQEIQYVLPPDQIGKKHTIGLWVPTEVLVNNHGDCDSKSLAYSAMLRRLGIPVIVIRVPGHVLVGVESKPGPDQKFVRIGNRYFVLCEPAGPGKLYPGNEGEEQVKGTFEYTLIEPATMGPAPGLEPQPNPGGPVEYKGGTRMNTDGT